MGGFAADTRYGPNRSTLDDSNATSGKRCGQPRGSMEKDTRNPPSESQPLQAWKVYAIAGICLTSGLATGYFVPASRLLPWRDQTAAEAAATTGGIRTTGRKGIPDAGAMSAVSGIRSGQRSNGLAASPHGGAMAAGGHMPTLDEMKQMADKQAQPLLTKLKSDPNNAAELVQVGAIYHSTHQFKEAAVYYGRAVQSDPKNTATRNKLASSLYRDGDVDGAIAQLNRALTYDPKDANALFNLGMIKLQGKQDGEGALAAWQRLLKANPQLSGDRKAAVQKLMAEVLTTLSDQRGNRGARSDGGPKTNLN